MTTEYLKIILYWGGVLFFLLLELLRSYRIVSVSKFRRWLANIPLSIVNGSIYYAVYGSLLVGLLTGVQSRSIGFLNQVAITPWIRVIIEIMILDFVMYVWHLLNHVVPLFWRFHRVHHSDMNMDVSTASRFHIGELLISGLLRLAVIYTFGITFFSYILFELLVNLAIQFHHSSIRISTLFERIWIKLFVPPSMHRIHHSVKIKERDSNYGALFSFWDRLMGTFLMDVDQDKIVIGIGSHRNFDNLGFWHLQAMPFTQLTR